MGRVMNDIPTKDGFLRANDGAAMVEFAFMMPLLLVFIFGVEEYGRLFLAQSTLERATYAAARCGGVSGAPSTTTPSPICPDLTTITSFANTQLWGIVSSSAVTFTPQISNSGSTFTTVNSACVANTNATGYSTAYVTVRASYPFSFIVNIPALVNSGSSTSVTLQATSIYPAQC